MLQRSHWRKLASLAGVLVCAGFLWVVLVAAVSEPPDEIIIHSKIWPKRKYEDTKFSHKKHATEYKIECKQCHHVYKDGENVWEEGQEVKKCEECHNVTKLGKALREASDEEKKKSLYKAFHTNCKGCHKEQKKEQKKAPVKCTECHAKKAKKPE